MRSSALVCRLRWVGGVSELLPDLIPTRPDRRREARRESARTPELRIGQGGMGEVVAVQRGGRLVAVKRLLPRLRSLPALAAQFEREAAIAARLAHPNVLPVLSVGDGEIVLELVHGVSLARAERALADRAEPCPGAVAAEIGRAAAAALGYVFGACGVVHRDVSPQNLLLAFDGRILLLDFGVARMRSDPRWTRTGVLKGKSEYMSPEQLRGEPLDGRADLFGLGVTLWELLAGRSPFVRRENEAQQGTLELAAVGDLAGLRPDLPRDLVAAIARCTALSAEHRPSSGEELANELAQLSEVDAVGPWLRSLLPEIADRETWLASLEPATAREHRQTVGGGAAVRDACFTPPDRVDEYQLLRLVGQGGMGAVFLANDTALQRRVAVKFVTCEDSQARARFLVEARAAARVHHPNVAAVHRVGETLGHPYLISEYVDGDRLDSLAPAPARRAVELTVGLLRGLEAAHAAGVLHRDIKPTNAIVAKDGTVKLLDFGVAKLVEVQEPVRGGRGGAGARITQQGYAVGTPCYMAPEVLCGEPATPRSDIYAVGALLYELCTGEPPFGDLDDEQAACKVLVEDPPPLSDLRAETDPELSAIVARALARDPAARWPSARAMRLALERLFPSVASLAREGNPYRGLRAFELEDRAGFFGRDEDIRAVVARLGTEAAVLVTGDSGCGKSSLCRAGVVPAVLDGALEDQRRWSAILYRPGGDPAYALAAALAPVLGVETGRVVPWILGDSAALALHLERVTSRGRGLLLLADQLEELVTLSSEAGARGAAEAMALFGTGQPGLRLLCTIRGDHLTRVASLPGLGDHLTRAVHLLRMPGRASLREAILAPARARGVSFESDALVGRLVETTLGAAGGLPLLQFALAELWDALTPGDAVITGDLVEQIGGVEGALVRHADGVLARLGDEERRVARRILVRLATNSGTRAIVPAGELLDAAADAAPVLDALVRGRLLCAREGADGGSYEVAHEALLSCWATLRGWLDDREGTRAMVERVRRAAFDWAQLGRSPDALWGRRPLAEVAALELDLLAPRERDFLDACHRRERRRRWMRTGTVAMVPILLVLGSTGLWLQRRHALQAQVHGLQRAATARLAQGRQAMATHESLRREAFTRFDEGAVSRAEGSWGRARSAALAAEEHLEAASQVLERALMLDGGRPDVRRSLAEITFERAVLAEREHRKESLAGHLQRLAVWDESREFVGRWSAPAPVSIETSPAGARYRLERYHADASGRLAAEPVSQGTTPMRRELPPGSYRVLLERTDHARVAYPFVVHRGQPSALQVRLLPEATVPEGFVHIPAGRFVFGSGDDESLRSDLMATAPSHETTTEAFLVARREVTFSDWIAFLEDLPPAERALRMINLPSGGTGGPLGLTRLSDGAYRLSMQPGSRPYAARSGAALRYGARRIRAEQDWLRFPVIGVSAADAEAYAAWLDRTGRVPGARLCSEKEWERAARGADDRRYPHGDRLAADDANFDETYGKDLAAFGPDEVGAHPASRSAFELDDLCGNASEWTRSTFEGERYVLRGGSYYFARFVVLATFRSVVDGAIRDPNVGFRVCAGISPAPQGS